MLPGKSWLAVVNTESPLLDGENEHCAEYRNREQCIATYWKGGGPTNGASSARRVESCTGNCAPQCATPEPPSRLAFWEISAARIEELREWGQGRDDLIRKAHEPLESIPARRCHFGLICLQKKDPVE